MRYPTCVRSFLQALSVEQLNTNVLIIGFGKGRKTLAGYLGKQEIETILVEQSEKMYGGTCIYIGCIPTKALVIQADTT